MSGLAALLVGNNPPNVYQWHNATPAPHVGHAVEHAGWRFAYLDGWATEDSGTFLKQAAAALDLDDDAASGFTAFGDALHRVTAADRRGLVLLWDGWSPLARHDQDAFDQAVASFTTRCTAPDCCSFSAVLRGAGPDLDLPELPAVPR